MCINTFYKVISGHALQVMEKVIKITACSFKGKIRTSKRELREEIFLLNTGKKFLKTVLVKNGGASTAKR